MKVIRWGGRLGLCCLLTSVFLWSCRNQSPSNFDSNYPPETIISGAPAESAQAFYQIHLYWMGSDRDGVVDHYEYSVTDSNKTPAELDPGFSGYFKTTSTDSVFRLTANLPQILGHRFYVRAVDNEDKVDPTPAWTYFVAEDANPPNVRWLSATASWTDRAGNTRTLTNFKSKNGNAPTDTVGVGATIRVSWDGFDKDPGGYVIGYEYRTSLQSQFSGGTLADTSVSLSFARPAGSALSSYFSGSEAIVVRAIDDAGARTNPDSIRSAVVNFGPVTWIVDPNQISPPVRALVFTEKQNMQTYPTRTTLADGSRSIQFKFTGFDDPRDMSLDPGNPSGVIGYSWRRLKNGGGPAYEDIDGLDYPDVSDFNKGTTLTSGDYTYFMRSKDELGRNGKPETLRVSVNYSPYFLWVRYLDENDMEQPLWNPPANPGDPTTPVQVTIHQLPGGGYPDFHFRFYALDEHHPPPNTNPRDINTVVETELRTVKEYAARMNNSREGFESAPTDTAGVPTWDERFFPVDPSMLSGAVRSGTNNLELRVRDISGRVTTLNLPFIVQLQ